MKVIVPLAGFGTRLRPHTWSKPKPLVSVAGKPVLGHVIDDLLQLAPEEMIFITGWLGDQIAGYVSRAYPTLKARYIEQTELKGQAHALALARDYVQGELVTVFVDTLFKADLTGLTALDADGAAFVKEVDDPRRFGVAVLDNGYVRHLVEKPATLENKLVLIGLYYFRQAERLFAAIDELMARNLQTKGEFYLADAINLMLQQGHRLKALPVAVWEDCGTAETVLATNRSILERRQPAVPTLPGVTIIPPVLIEPGATVERAVIGPHVSIAAGASVRDAIVRDAIIDSGASVEQALIEHSIVGGQASLRGRFQRVNLGEHSAVTTEPGEW
jgi:glucose-1-phosphate thymidylyltransferase